MQTLLLRKQVQAAMMSWTLRFQETKFKPEQIQLLIREYFDDLADEEVTGSQFEAAVKIVNRQCRFFPKMVDILEAVREYRSRPPAPISGQKQLAEDPPRKKLTSAEKEKNKKRVEIMGLVISKKISWKQGQKMQSEL